MAEERVDMRFGRYRQLTGRQAYVHKYSFVTRVENTTDTCWNSLVPPVFGVA